MLVESAPEAAQEKQNQLLSYFRFIFSGALGGMIIAIVQMLSLGSTFALPLTPSVFCFAAGISILTMYGLIFSRALNRDEVLPTANLFVAGFLGRASHSAIPLGNVLCFWVLLLGKRPTIRGF